MYQIKLKLNEDGQGAFYSMDGEVEAGEMVIGVSGNDLTVFHTEVAPPAEGTGLAKNLLDAVAGFARKNGLKVIPRCTYVQAQFKRHPEDYADVWNKDA